MYEIAHNYLDLAIDWICASGLYADEDLREQLIEYKPSISIEPQVVGCAAYSSWSQEIHVKNILCEAFKNIIEGNLNEAYNYSTYYLPKIDTYVEHDKVSAHNYCIAVMVHELTHHIQRKRQRNNFYHKRFVHTKLDFVNDESFSLKSIKTIECETTYNEIACMRSLEPNIDVYSVRKDKQIVLDEFENGWMKIHKYIYSSRNIKTIPNQFTNLTLPSSGENIFSDLKQGGITLTNGEFVKLVCIRKSTKPSASYIFYSPEYDAYIETIRWRNMKINKLIGRQVSNNNYMYTP